ncbi:MAG: metallophosphoesterase [Clostridia bacterium]|nr:metallophosphoesterase [Clostridia bacterium]
MKTVNENFLCHPSVIAVEDEYQIIVPVKERMLFWVEIGGKRICDHANGILRSETMVHRVNVPMTLLDEAKKYTVVFRKVIDRQPYFPKFFKEVRVEYDFRPLTKTEDIHMYMLSDVHGMREESVKAASYFGDKLDVLLMNGDIANHSGNVENICLAFEIISDITGGEIPVIFSRGNHDNRGLCAELLPQITPNYNGRTFYTVKLGPIWAALVDCGEDKEDAQEEYGGTICFSDFRDEEELWLDRVCDKKEFENFRYKFIISHIPFTWNNTEADEFGNHPFNIEVERYTRWAKKIKDGIKPDLMLCGHLHRLAVSDVGGEFDCKGQPCPVLIGAMPMRKEGRYIGSAIVLNPTEAEIKFTDDNSNVVGEGKVCFGVG